MAVTPPRLADTTSRCELFGVAPEVCIQPHTQYPILDSSRMAHCSRDQYGKNKKTALICTPLEHTTFVGLCPPYGAGHRLKRSSFIGVPRPTTNRILKEQKIKCKLLVRYSLHYDKLFSVAI